METAVKAVKDKSLSLRKSAQKNNIKKCTLADHVEGKHTGTLGSQQEIPVNIAELLAEWVDQVADWGWPIGLVTLQLMVKNILEKNGIVARRLEKNGIVAKRLEKNTAGECWMRNFVTRNNISRRAASNIKRAKAKGLKLIKYYSTNFSMIWKKTLDKTGSVPSLIMMKLIFKMIRAASGCLCADDGDELKT